MGLMRFLVPRRERLAADAIDRAYCSGMDDIPWQSRTQWTEDGLAVRRTEHDSGCFHIPWRVAGWGELLLGTATLMERESAYHLTVELARGSLNRLRNQIAVWQSVGMTIAATTAKYVEQSLQHLALAATIQRKIPSAE